MKHRSSMLATALLCIPPCALFGQSPPPDKADALWKAARNGDAAVVQKLLEEGVDVNTKFRYGATALSYACDRGHLEVVKVLLARGADVDVKDTFYGATPLSWAAGPAQARKPQHAEIVGLLLKRGAQGKEQALMTAVRGPDAAMLGVILEQGGLAADTLSDALEAATKPEQAELVRLLERAGARPHPTPALSEAQLARYAGAYSDGSVELSFAVKDGRLQGGPPGQVMTLQAKDETSFRVPGRAGLAVLFTLEADKASSVTVKQGGSTTVYKRVLGK
jgi:hypothetical protein